MTLLVGEEHYRFAVTFGAMAFSTFVFDTLDVTTRLGRYIVQELTGWRGRSGAVAGTLVTLAPPALFLSGAGQDSYKQFWTLFGASNQLLAALTLTTVTVWMHGRSRRSLFTLVPMLFVFVITVWALLRLLVVNLQAAQGLDVSLINAFGAAAFVALAFYLAATALRRLLAAPLATAD
jgi:carbon starvation protein